MTSTTKCNEHCETSNFIELKDWNYMVLYIM